MYKEKYLKYKSKYLDLKNQIGGKRPIIMDIKLPTQQAQSAQSAQSAQPAQPALPALEKTEIHRQLENGELLFNDYIKCLDPSLKSSIIINPENRKFYSMNDFYYNNEFVFDHDVNVYTDFINDTVIIIKRPILNETQTCTKWGVNDLDRITFVGLIINYTTKKIIVMYYGKNTEYVGNDGKLYFIKIYKIIEMLKLEKEFLERKPHWLKFRRDFKDFIGMLKEGLADISVHFNNYLPKAIATSIIQEIESIKENLDEINKHWI